MEQAEYAKEKIEWSFISFPDNVLTLDLIEHRTTGILAMVDDECRLPGAADEKLASRLYKAFASHSRFSATAAQVPTPPHTHFLSLPLVITLPL